MTGIILISMIIGFILGMYFEVYLGGYKYYYWDKYILKQ